MLNLDQVERRDYLGVALFTLLLYAVVLAAGGPLTMHEGVLSQTTKAMLTNHDWLVPRYGDAPWLERPPLPQWISCVICAVLGHPDQEWNMRVGPALSGLITVLLTTWVAGRMFGRGVGILSGLMLATMYNFVRYSTLAEADIFLAPIVAAAMCVFAYVEIIKPPQSESWNPFGTRSWWVLAFFVFLGMTNLAKGLVFGTIIVLAPVGTFLLWNFRWASFARYTWLWGAVAFCSVALPWPLLVVYTGWADAVEVWRFDLFGRLNRNYLAEPAWYYFVCLFWVLQPWTFPALLGLGLTFKKLWRDGDPALRFVWCWAWMPLLVFSFSQGKHHHYMLHYMGPWAILSALGVVWAWQRVTARWPSWRADIAVIAGFACLFVLLCAGFAYKGMYLHRSREDTAFLFAARAAVPAEQPLLLNSADEALEGLRMQFYVGDKVTFMHNLSYVRDDRLSGSVIHVVTRYNRLPILEKYGQVDSLLQCKQSRRETSPADRWTLFRIQLPGDFERKKLPERITPMQAMYREAGPDLD